MSAPASTEQSTPIKEGVVEYPAPSDERSASWPGIVEHFLIFLVMPLVWITLLIFAMIGLWGYSGYAGIAEGITAAALVVTAFFLAAIFYFRESKKRKVHWNGLIYPIAVRWISIVHVIFLIPIMLVILLRASPPPICECNGKTGK